MVIATRHDIAPGTATALGPKRVGEAVNFALFSEHATGVDLCLFDDDGMETRIPIEHETNRVWHAAAPNIPAGQRYGYRVHGPWDPPQGFSFNPNKLLVDPYARAISGAIDWSGPLYGFQKAFPSGELLLDPRDDAAFVPKSVIVDETFDWEDDAPPAVPWSETIIYETHLKGFTQLHPSVPDAVRGTYAGLAHPSAIEHLLRLGVTSVELLPIHAFIDDHFLVDRHLRNYWGYNSLGFFAPEARYSNLGDRGGQVTAFKQMVKTLHRAGLEVILDVVYNHTAEAGDFGPTLSFRGIDNSTYYHLTREIPRRVLDWTGTGNTVRVSHPAVLRLVMDSLRYWVEEMHVDGFRFDLAPALARDEHGFSERSAFFAAIHQDPVLSRVKLIAEPWDIGDGGYRTGAFPRGWSEWNDRFRDAARLFWLGGSHRFGDLGFRLAGSRDIFAEPGRGPSASINFITAHDGFTLADLVSYSQKHNLANGEHNRDGSDHNLSNNFGVEGPTADPDIIAVRNRERKNLLATLMVSLGVPMMLGGDEFGRTQRGNNNAYCQDNRVSWFDWDLARDEADFLDFTSRLVRLRMRLGPLWRDRPANNAVGDGASEPRLAWFRPDGAEMRWEDWIDPAAPAFAFSLAGTFGGEEIGCFVALNAGDSAIAFAHPPAPAGLEWRLECSTDPAGIQGAMVPPRSVAIHVLASAGAEGEMPPVDALV